MDKQKNLNKKTIYIIGAFVILILAVNFLGNGKIYGLFDSLLGKPPSKVNNGNDNGDRSGPCSVSITAATNPVASGNSTLINWTFSNGCNNVSISPIIGSVSSSPGSLPSGPLVAPVDFIIIGYNNAGTPSIADVYVNVSGYTLPVPCPSSSVPGSSANGVIRFYEDRFNGGVTVGGYSPPQNGGVATGNFSVSIPAGSTIRKAYLLAGHRVSCAPLTVTLNSTPYTFDSSNQVGPTFVYYSSGAQNASVHALDITSNINPTVNNYTLSVPAQYPTNHRFNDFALYVAYNNPSMPLVDATIFLNNRDFAASIGYSILHNLTFTVPVANAYPVALSLMTGGCNPWLQYVTNPYPFPQGTSDSTQVTVGTTLLGSYLCPDINSPLYGGPLGSFSYSNGTITALSDDNANQAVSGADVLSDISATLLSPNVFNLNLTFHPITGGYQNNPNLIWAEFVTYRDNRAALTLIKNVINNNGGTATANAWTLSAAGSTPISGATGSPAVTNAVVNTGTYALSESAGPGGYTASSWVCVGGSQSGSNITVTAGQSATCTITNDDIPSSSPPPPVKVVGGTNHSLALKNDGTLWSWGSNYYGQIGDGSGSATRNDPVQVSNSTNTGFLTGITSVGGDALNALVLRNDGTVWAWGYNENGQFGDNTTGNTSNLPVQVHGPGNSGFLSNIIAVASGPTHSLAVKNDGTVWAWGKNQNGQLGDGTTTQRLTPVQVSVLTGVTAVAAGNAYSVALKNDGTVWAWGYNGNGQLGDGTTTQRLTPVQVTGVSGITGISTGWSHTIARKNDGTTWGWGWNYDGQLCNGGTSNATTNPTQMTGLTGATSVSAGGQWHSLILKSNGTVWSCGLNQYGQLGDGTTIQRLTAVQVTGLTGVTAIAGGGGHSFALKSDNTIWSWGWNESGQLGNGTISTLNSNAPPQSTPIQTNI
jgi:alpha-tubulin suppressor-like RCC1 family protein